MAVGQQGLGQGHLGVLGSAGVRNINWVAEGDSITAGLGGTPTYPHIVLSLLSGASQAGGNTPTTGVIPGVGNVTIQNIATSGISALTIDQNYATRAGASYNAAKNLNVLSLMIGTNTSGVTDNTDQSKYYWIRDYIRRAQLSGYQRIILCSMIARDDDGGTTWNNILVPLNTLLSTYYNSDLRCDGYVNFAADARFSPNTAADDTTNYNADKLHPLTGVVGPPAKGQQAMAALANATVLAALQGAGARTVVPTWSTITGDNSTVTLSNGNRTAVGASGNKQILGFPATKGANKICFELTVDNVGTFTAIGLVNETFNPTSTFIYQGTNSVAWLYDGRFFINGAQVASGTAYTTGDVLQVCYDQGNQLGWCRPIRAGTPLNWNGNASANPVTGVGGFSTATLGSGYVHVGANIGTQLTTSFSAAQLTQAIPSGYSAYAP